jgi:hypothetical protein
MLLTEYGSGSTCHRRFQEWSESGVLDKLIMDQIVKNIR